MRGEIKMRTIDDFTVPKEYLSPFDKYLKAAIREWADKEVIPYRRKFDEDYKEHKYVEPAFKKLMVDLGFQKSIWPDEFGGWGLGQSNWMMGASFRVMQEVSRADSGMGVALGVHWWPLVTIAVEPHVRMDLCEEFAPMYVETDTPTFSATAMTEPQGGSDIENLGAETGRTIQTTAELDGDEWVINGHKLWPTNSGGVCKLFGVVCTTNRGSRDPNDFAFIFVPTDVKGVKQGEPYQKAGMAADKNSDIWFDDVRVPKEYRAWRPGDDIKYFGEIMSSGSMGSIAFLVGAMENVYEILKDYVSSRTFHGKPLKENDAFAGVLSDIVRDVEIGSITGYQLAHMLDHPDIYGDRWGPEMTTKARLYKMWLADRAVEDVGKAMDLMGLYGCDREHDIEKHWRDIKIIQLWMGGKQLCQMETARWFYECETL